MGTPFKMKGFSGFKESPVKGKGDNLKRIMTENKDAAKKAGTWYKSTSADPKYKGKGNFNFTGDSKSTTPKYSTTKAARVKAHDAAINRLSTNPKTANLPKKEFDKLSGKTSKSFTKPSKTKNFKKTFDKFQAQKQKGKQFVKGLKKAGKFLGGKTLGVLGMLSATSSKADQPKLKKGDTHYRDPKKSIF